MDHSRALPHLPKAVKLIACGAFAIFAIASGAWAAHVCSSLMQQLAPTITAATRVAMGE